MTDNLEIAIIHFMNFMLPFIWIAVGVIISFVPAELFKKSKEKEIETSKDEFKNNTCYFCGSPFTNDWRANNAEDFRLHPETQGKVCCPRCDKLVTNTNRNISLFLKGTPMDEEDFGGNLFYLEEAAVNLLDFVKEERNARGKMSER